MDIQAAFTSNQANAVLKRITVLLGITTPLNLIASVMGMNVYPLNEVQVIEKDENITVFVSLMVAMLLTSLLLLLAAKQNSWL